MKIYVYVARISPKPKKKSANLLQFQKILEETRFLALFFLFFSSPFFFFFWSFLIQIFQFQILVSKYGFRKLTLNTQCWEKKKKKVIAHIYYVLPQVDY